MDDRETYRQWAATIKASGGVATVFPSGPSRGLPAARYPVARIVELQKAKRLGEPGVTSADRKFGYYLATPKVAMAAKALPEATKAEIAVATANTLKQWDPFGIGATLKKAAIIGAVVTIGLQLLPYLLRSAGGGQREWR